MNRKYTMPLENVPRRPVGTGFLRADRFTSLAEQPQHQFDAWRRLMAPILTVKQVDPVALGFRVATRAFDLGRLHLASVDIDPMAYSHTLDHVRMSGIDHWCLSLLKSGSEVIRFGDNRARFAAGSLHVVSMAHPFQGRSSETGSIRAFLSRDDFSDISDMLDAASMGRLEGPLATILKEYLISLESLLPKLPLGSLSVVTESFGHLLSAALKPSVDGLAAADAAISASRFNLARKYIQHNLKSTSLDPKSIHLALGISRRQLYHLFERYGGVASFIKQRRLAACCRAIADANDHRLISSIAYSYGYVDPALFSRQFQAEFGFNPSEAREARLSGHLPPDTPPDTFAEWLLHERGAEGAQSIDGAQPNGESFPDT